MTGNITPDIFLSMEFEEPINYKNFSDYLEYMIDESKTQTKTYESYHEYMFDETKTDSAFTKNKDFLDELEILKQKELFSIAQEKNSFMWKFVISFNNQFLIKNNILKNGIVNDKKLKECARESIEKMLKLENITGYTYSGAIHYNTDNIHIHLSIVELGEPSRKCIFDKNLSRNERCKNAFFKKSTFEKGKSVVNSVLSNDLENLKELNFLSRKKIIQNIDFKDINFSKEEIEILKEIKEKLPLNQNLWQYNNKKISHIKPLLNKFTTKFLYNHFKEEIKEYKEELLEAQNLYTIRYGKGKYEHNFYMKNCLDDLYTRGANKVLKNLKDFDLDFKNIDEKISLDKSSNEIFLTKEQKKIYKEVFKFQKEILADNIEKFKEQYEKLEKEELKNTQNIDIVKYQISLFTCFKNIFFDFEQILQEESYYNLMRYKEIKKETIKEREKSLEK